MRLIKKMMVLAITVILLSGTLCAQDGANDESGKVYALIFALCGIVLIGMLLKYDLMDLLKTIAKFAVIGVVCYFVIWIATQLVPWSAEVAWIVVIVGFGASALFVYLLRNSMPLELPSKTFGRNGRKK
jgi:hypothetical protein